MLICSGAGGGSMISDGRLTEPGCSLSLFVCTCLHAYIYLFVPLALSLSVCVYLLRLSHVTHDRQVNKGMCVSRVDGILGNWLDWTGVSVIQSNLPFTKVILY